MTRLVDDLLDVSRITRGRIELRSEPLDLRDVLLAAREATLPIIEAAGQTVDLAVGDQALPLDGDPARLTQVLSNLLNNASKFMDAGGKIRVGAEHDGDGLVVTVQDEGIGVPPEFQSSIFDMFIQVDRSLERSKGGLGIGLALARTIVELHGGTIAIPQRGTWEGQHGHRAPSVGGLRPRQRLARDGRRTIVVTRPVGPRRGGDGGEERGAERHAQRCGSAAPTAHEPGTTRAADEPQGQTGAPPRAPSQAPPDAKSIAPEGTCDASPGPGPGESHARVDMRVDGAEPTWTGIERAVSSTPIAAVPGISVSSLGARVGTKAGGAAALAAARRILVADDNDDSAESMSLMLELQGFHVFRAVDGEDAVATAATVLPEVILLDIGMPRMNGYAAARRLREQCGKDVIIIAVTGFGQNEDRQKSQEAGFDAHLTKPVEMSVLRRLIDGNGRTLS
jgi:CheY-like chemotaxis protein